MSTATIYYKDLIRASGEAKDVARKLDKYADSLNSRVYKKLNKYDGSVTSNITAAKNQVNAKINELRSAQDKYETYATNLRELRDECKSVDKAVRSKVSSLTATFKENHGISNNWFVNTVSYLFTSDINSSAVGRWISNLGYKIKSGRDYLRSCIKEWYNYKGGKEFIKGALIAVLEIAIAAITLLTGTGGILAMIAAVIALVGGAVNLGAEIAGLMTAGKDPAAARRMGKVDSLQDMLRLSDSKIAHIIAGGIDAVQFVCAIGELFTGITKLIKNGYKWATGSFNTLKKISWKAVFSKNTFTKFIGKFKDIGQAFKTEGWSFVWKGLSNIKADFITNLKNGFNFGDIKGIKATLKLTKDLFKKGLTIGVVFEHIISPSFSIGNITTYDSDSSGQFKFDFDSIRLGDITGLWEKLSEKILGSDFLNYEKELPIDVKVLDKLNSTTDIDISIPDIKIPDINIPVLRIA